MLMPITLYREAPTHPQAQACQACAVRRDALFGALDEQGLHQLHTHIEAPSFAADAPIFGEGRRGASMLTIRAGVVRFERVTAQGERRIVRLAGRGDLIGQEALLGQPYAEDAVAATEVEVCRLPVGLVDELGQTQRGVTQELMRRWQRALAEAQTWSMDITTGSAPRRLLHLLLRLQALAGHDGLAWLPRREEMADMADLRTETVSRWISRWRREGWVEPLPPRHARLHSDGLRQALDALDD
ncbi:MAG: Crp/Fnr family transcriptional regulator [Hydrogenophaga sp.]|uniref:Crp/Fnr family transcriptional regulator n=1 Tax=Hydrogenophaga sp. TaxID=1904254 RepID=UPI001D66FA55|nr:Crp/Fnr family transcriptional regulator [Hydrogenophaga sp.]MBX3608475.1 Crp/Fnr family transcriptional regulator [Hydrogenophaga sp.]